MRTIGLETSALMPLLEVTPRTFPLQTQLQKALHNGEVVFVTDTYSVDEARQQVETSYTNALRSLEKAGAIAQ